MKWTAIAIGLVVIGCASVNSDVPRHVRDAELCLRVSGECTVIQVDNAGLSDANLYLNGGRIGFAPGLSKTTIFIPDSRLGGDRCISIFIRLNAVGLRAQSDRMQTTRECVNRGGHFQLSINPLLSVSSLTPRTAR